MQYRTFIGALTVLITSAAALPFKQSQAREPCPSEHPQYQDVIGNQSSIFATQFVGSTLCEDEIDTACNALNSGGYEKWSKQGLDIDSIRKTVCDAKETKPNISLALPNIAKAATNVFSTQLANAFDKSNATTFHYLCSNIRYVQLSSFYLNDATIVTSICSSVNDRPAPQPFTPLANINQSAVTAYHQAASKLYAYEYASAATSASQLHDYCALAPDFHEHWTQLGLDAKVVEDTLCSVKKPMTVEQGKAAISKWSSTQFSTVLENISNAEGYHKWLCENLNPESMNEIGLDGELVHRSACQL